MTSKMLDKACTLRTDRTIRQLSAPCTLPSSSMHRIQSKRLRVRAAELSASGWQSTTGSQQDVARTILQAAMQGKISLDEAAAAVASFSSGHQDTSTPTLTKSHQAYPEVVWGAGKIADQVANQLLSLSKKQRVTLALKIEPDMYAAVRKLAPGVKYNMAARCLIYSPEDSLPKQPRMHGTIALLATNTADTVVTEEFKAVAEAMGCYVFKVANAGNLHGVLQNLEGIRSATAVVVVTGVDTTLPSVLAELVDSPVIAVPTTASQTSSSSTMLSALASSSNTAPGVSMISSNNGFAGAMLAARILKSAEKLHELRAEAEAAQRSAAAAAAALEAAQYASTMVHADTNGHANGHAFPVNGYANMYTNGAFIHPEMQPGINGASFPADAAVLASASDSDLAEAMGQLHKAFGGFSGNETGNGIYNNGTSNGNSVYANSNGNGYANGNGIHHNGYANGNGNNNGSSNGKVHVM